MEEKAVRLDQYQTLNNTKKTGMQFSRKKFSQSLHDKYDPPARKAVTDWIKMKWGLECIPNPNVYGVDLIVLRGGNPVGFVEVEVRGWAYCHYPTIHLAQRKDKLFQQDLPVLKNEFR